MEYHTGHRPNNQLCYLEVLNNIRTSYCLPSVCVCDLYQIKPVSLGITTTHLYTARQQEIVNVKCKAIIKVNSKNLIQQLDLPITIPSGNGGLQHNGSLHLA